MLSKLHFPKDFIWGTATAAYQIEGAVKEDGRGPSIWDTFTRIPGKVRNMENADITDDFYHRYEEDIASMAELGFKAYRFSLAWPRIIPDGDGEVNPKGLAFYHKIFQELKKYDIKPYVTLYHWDLPQALQDKGGWENRETAYAFERYAKICFEEFKEECEEWFTINEPMVITTAGYLTGRHAPGVASLDACLKAMHHVNLAHGLGVRAFREGGYKGRIGIVINTKYHQPLRDCEEDWHAVNLCAAFQTKVFTGPIFRGEYPKEVTEELGYQFPIKEGDMELIHQKVDYAGINFYREYRLKWDDDAFLHFTYGPQWEKKTGIGYPITPEGFYRNIKLFWEDVGRIPIMVTENGVAFDDVLTPEGTCDDYNRIEFYHDYLEAAERCIEEGVDLRGYFCWSLLDNFEWALGYKARFGLIYVDFINKQKRTVKASGYYLRDVIYGMA